MLVHTASLIAGGREATAQTRISTGNAGILRLFNK